jgi:hypothetical protein
MPLQIHIVSEYLYAPVCCCNCCSRDSQCARDQQLRGHPSQRQISVYLSGMSDLQSLHTQARKLVLTIRAGLERQESSEHVSSRHGRTALRQSTHASSKMQYERSARRHGHLTTAPPLQGYLAVVLAYLLDTLDALMPYAVGVWCLASAVPWLMARCAALQGLWSVRGKERGPGLLPAACQVH